MKLFKKTFVCFIILTFFIGLGQTGIHTYAVSHDSKKEKTFHDIKDQEYKKIIIKFKNELNLPYEDGIEKTIQTEKNDTVLKEFFLKYPNVSLNRLFTSVKPEEIQTLSTNVISTNNLLNYYIMSVPKDIDVESLLKHMRKSTLIEEVYEQEKPVEPAKPTLSPQMHKLPEVESPNLFLNPHNNPRFKNQGYLMEAPNGINAVYAWNIEGADGKGITVMDMEYGWLLNHEKLANQNIELVSGQNVTGQRAHGTGVLGIISQEDSHVGGIGITPAAKVKVVSQIRDDGSYNTADALLSAINNLKYGDILLLEAQATYEGYGDKYLPLEVHPELFDVIRAGTDKGIVIVETAGNGSNDLDQFKNRNGKQPLNIKSPDFKDSGAILVGAGSSSVPHKRLWYSNYGSRIDTYGWGENVDTTSADPVKNDVNLYTTTFSGTSSAGPIITGAAASIQGAATARWGDPYSPDILRDILRNESTATPSHNPKADRIGVLPDLKAVFTWLGLSPTSTILKGDQFAWSLQGGNDFEFAKIDFNKKEEVMQIQLNECEWPHWNFEETYASIKVQKSTGEVVFNNEIYGNKKLNAETKKVSVKVGDFIELTHKEGGNRAIFTNADNQKQESFGNKVVYKVTIAGLEKVEK
ncbi:putative mucin/carbohydrate-binding domain-containing protein [Bacillus thuringiensis]|uniref:Uncharacterized protein n=1 Tax=Bacillus thuringiensis TaxID=1428 RepID=A0A9X6TNF9_BACTU|nr:putative mucin/carbohydrate-binding domain-containing protein [Bacillus thuringiensis]PEA89590.1 hypothetical protein CON71_12975 [Bacillus thuringiensis]